MSSSAERGTNGVAAPCTRYLPGGNAANVKVPFGPVTAAYLSPSSPVTVTVASAAGRSPPRTSTRPSRAPVAGGAGATGRGWDAYRYLLRAGIDRDPRRDGSNTNWRAV